RIVVLDRGELQQIDTPMRVYERPANLFVAGFIGSPAMNFLRGRIVRQDGLQLELGFARVHLANSGGTGGELAPLVGAEVVVGLTLAAAPLPAQVESITVDAAAPTQPFPHFWERMFGSGRAVLSLRESYREDLRAVRAVTAVAYVRFHAILHDEVGVYSEDSK